MKKLLPFITMMLLSVVVLGQQKITGTVKDAQTGDPIPGTNVFIKGTNTGVTTNLDGVYTIQAESNETLVFSFIGYKTLEEEVGSRSIINISMETDLKSLDEVVVTALGIEREERSLSYAAEEVKGGELAVARESNIMNNLSGKVPGLVVSPSGTGMGGSTKITIRGSSFLSGNNQPLVVVDGVPIDNMGAATDDTWGNRQIDYGNGLNDINMDDVESMSILKGPAASALYGSRAGNGVIMITTKSAKKGTSGIDFNSNTVIEVPRPYLKMQNQYGQGTTGVFDPESGLSWGPEMNAQEVTDWTGETKPFLPRDNNILDFLQNGVSTVNTVSMFSANQDKNIRASVGHTYSKGVYPTSNIQKINASLKGGAKLSEHFDADFSMNYNKTEGENRIKLTRDPDNPYYSYTIMPRSISYADLKNNVRDETTYQPLRWAPNGGVILNPYFSTKYNTNEDSRNRFIGYGKLIYSPIDALTFHVRYGIDHYDMRQRDQLGTGVPYWFSSGDVRQTMTSSTETNIEFMGRLKPVEIGGGLSLSMTLGGNLLEAKSYSQTSSANGLVVPDFYSLNNSIDKDASEYIYRREMNSIFGMAQLSFKEFLYLDITERIDWSSTLPEENRSYDYPSVGLSWVISDSFEGMPSWISLAKVRGSYAVAGKDAEPYNLYLTNSIGASGAVQPDTKPNPELKRELLQSKEVGLDLNFFNNGVSFAYTYYHNNTIDQIMPIPVNPATGFSFEMVNAGNMQNSGHEVALNIGLIRNAAFQANVGLNWAKNNNKIIKLHEELDRYLIGDGLVQVVAEEGGTYGDIYGYTYMTDDNGNMILNEDGHFQRSNERVMLGNFNPDWNAGITGSASYTGDFGAISFSILFDYMKGGDIYSFTNAQAAAYGTSAITTENNRGEYSIEGVNANGEPVTGSMTAQQYWSAKATIDSEWVYDKSEINLREVTLGYRLPASLFNDSGIRGASLSIVGRNLSTFGSNLNGVPPFAYTTSNQQGAEAYSAPRTATVGFNLKLQF